MRRTITMEELWGRADFQIGQNLSKPEVALLQLAFASGVLATMNAAVKGRAPDPDDTARFVKRALRVLKDTAVRDIARPAYPAASDQ